MHQLAAEVVPRGKERREYLEESVRMLEGPVATFSLC